MYVYIYTTFFRLLERFFNILLEVMFQTASTYSGKNVRSGAEVPCRPYSSSRDRPGSKGPDRARSGPDGWHIWRYFGLWGNEHPLTSINQHCYFGVHLKNKVLTQSQHVFICLIIALKALALDETAGSALAHGQLIPKLHHTGNVIT